MISQQYSTQKKRGRPSTNTNKIRTPRDFFEDGDYDNDQEEEHKNEKETSLLTLRPSRKTRRSAAAANVKILSALHLDDLQNDKEEEESTSEMIPSNPRGQTNDAICSMICAQQNLLNMRNKKQRLKDDLSMETAMKHAQFEMLQAALQRSKQIPGLNSKREQEKRDNKVRRTEVLRKEMEPIIENTTEERIDFIKKNIRETENCLVNLKIVIDNIGERILKGQNLYKFSCATSPLMFFFTEFENSSFNKYVGEILLKEVLEDCPILGLVCKRLTYFYMKHKIEKKQLASDDRNVIDIIVLD